MIDELREINAGCDHVIVKADSDYPAQSGTIVLIDDGIHIDLNDGQEPIKCRPDELEKV